MRKIFLLFLIIFIYSCRTNKNDAASAVPYKTVHNYFVKNTCEIPDVVEKVITTKDEFDKIFDAAAFMGKNGKPTPIDFSKENAIILLHPKTNKEVEIIPLKLEKKTGDEFIYRYHVKTGGERSGYANKKSSTS